MAIDPTFDPASLYGSTAWTALRMGLTVDTFQRRLRDMVSEGFPSRDRITGRFIKADVDAFVDRRRRYTDRAMSDAPKPTEANLENL